ncbi:MAG: lysozyme inhibitor LprI family protein [Pseudomonadota bacterium]
MRALICLAVLANPAAAQDLVFTPAHTEACLASTQSYDGRHACVGVSAQRCMEDTAGGQSTYGMGGCLSAEFEYWDQQLNALYGAAIDAARAFDADMAGVAAHLATQEANLRAMQRAWIAFRDATCDYEYSQWGGGTGGGPAIAGCMMRMTGEQALYLFSNAQGG